MLAVAAVLTNAGLITFTMDDLDTYSESTKFWIFIGFQWICFSMQVRSSALCAPCWMW
jgi:uncharacterized metal-binding protein